MNPKQLIFHEAAHAKIMAGVNALTNAVRSTLGPKARTVVRMSKAQRLQHLGLLLSFTLLALTGFATLFIGILPNRFIEMVNWALGIAQNPAMARLIR
jgi:hypothetical protein